MSDVIDPTDEDKLGAPVPVWPLVAAVDLLTPVLRRALQVLAVSVALTSDELARVWSESFVDKDPLSSSELAAIQALPLVQTLGRRMRVTSSLAVELARQVLDGDAAAFDRVHRSLVAIERAREETLEREDPGGTDLWQTKALVAYYLLRNSPEAASSRFIESFDDVPLNDRRACRLWLADLNDRYQQVSGQETRIGRFFLAFRQYVAGLRDLSASSFRLLLTENESDQVAAISQHLLAVNLPWHDRERRVLLESSIDLSSKLGLTENLLMTRNTLVFQLLRESRQPDLGGADVLGGALKLAIDNDALADFVGLPVYQTATRYSRAVLLVETADRDRRLQGESLDSISAVLDAAESFAVSAHDLAAWLRPRLVRVDVMVRLGRSVEALSNLQIAVEAVERAEALPELPRRQFERQVERIQAQLPPDGAEYEQVDELDRRFRRALRRR